MATNNGKQIKEKLISVINIKSPYFIFLNFFVGLMEKEGTHP